MILILLLMVILLYFWKIHLEKKIKNSETIMKSDNPFSLQTYKQKKIFSNIIALVFYGRQSSVSILLKYLEKNLKSNGGILDKIVFAVRTNKIEDIRYLDKYLKNKSKNEYKRFKTKRNKDYKDAYKNLNNNDLVFKIDDDVVFISNGTFERMVEEYLKNDLLILSANVVNHPALTYVHEKIGAILPFIEIKNYTFVKMDNSTKNTKNKNMVQELSKRKTYAKHPVIAAITHKSFFVHFENKNLKIYDFGLWDFHSLNYTRWSINFILFKGKYVRRLNSKFGSDEHSISLEIPKEHKKHAYALGSALVSHFSYEDQYDYLRKTDILNKYKKISNDFG